VSHLPLINGSQIVLANSTRNVEAKEMIRKWFATKNV
jgi:hypothetical protein